MLSPRTGWSVTRRRSVLQMADVITARHDVDGTEYSVIVAWRADEELENMTAMELERAMDEHSRIPDVSINGVTYTEVQRDRHGKLWGYADGRGAMPVPVPRRTMIPVEWLEEIPGWRIFLTGENRVVYVVRMDGVFFLYGFDSTRHALATEIRRLTRAADKMYPVKIEREGTPAGDVIHRVANAFYVEMSSFPKRDVLDVLHDMYRVVPTNNVQLLRRIFDDTTRVC
jgi:hypothetical protein